VEVQKLCRKHGVLLISDEVQCGLGRRGSGSGSNIGTWSRHITLAKSLSGGYVPVAAIVMRREIYQKTFNQMDRCVVHSSTFGVITWPMAAGWRRSSDRRQGPGRELARMGELLISRLEELKNATRLSRNPGKGAYFWRSNSMSPELTLKLGGRRSIRWRRTFLPRWS